MNTGDDDTGCLEECSSTRGVGGWVLFAGPDGFARIHFSFIRGLGLGCGTATVCGVVVDLTSGDDDGEGVAACSGEGLGLGGVGGGTGVWITGRFFK